MNSVRDDSGNIFENIMRSRENSKEDSKSSDKPNVANKEFFDIGITKINQESIKFVNMPVDIKKNSIDKQSITGLQFPNLNHG